MSELTINNNKETHSLAMPSLIFSPSRTRGRGASSCAHHVGSIVQTARIISGECVQIGQTSTQTLTLFSSRMTWKRTGQEPPTINSHPASAAGHPQPPSRACTPPPGPPVTPNLSTRQPQNFGAWPSMGPGVEGAAGDAAASGRPPAPGFMRAGGWRFGITVVPGVGRGSGETDGHSRGRAGTSPGALAGWLLMVEGSWVVCTAGASPLHPP